MRHKHTNTRAPMQNAIETIQPVLFPVNSTNKQKTGAGMVADRVSESEMERERER